MPTLTMIDPDDAELSAFIAVERASPRSLLHHVADQREHDPQAAKDPRYLEAAANLRDVAETVPDVSDDLLLRVALIARMAEEHGGGSIVSEIIAAKLTAACFLHSALPSATALLRSIADVADRARAKAMGSLN